MCAQDTHSVPRVWETSAQRSCKQVDSVRHCLFIFRLTPFQIKVRFSPLSSPRLGRRKTLLWDFVFGNWICLDIWTYSGNSSRGNSFQRKRHVPRAAGFRVEPWRECLIFFCLIPWQGVPLDMVIYPKTLNLSLFFRNVTDLNSVPVFVKKTKKPQKQMVHLFSECKQNQEFVFMCG